MVDDDVATENDSQVQGTPPASPAKKKTADLTAAASKPAKATYLEMDSLNDNPCMPVILQVRAFFIYLFRLYNLILALGNRYYAY